MDNRQGVERLFRALREYFAAPPYENEVVVVLLIPAFLILAWLWFSKGPTRTGPRFPAKELEFFRMASLQKGLEEFDRTLLLDLAETYQIRPIYKLILERDAFRTLQEKFRRDHPDTANTGTKKPSVVYLAQLEKKLFPEPGAA